MELLSDFQKMECPFVRKIFSVHNDGFKKYGRQLQLLFPEVYLVTNEMKPKFYWVLSDPDTIAIEKLDGTNVKLKTNDGRLQALQNRKNIIDPLMLLKGKAFIIEGIFSAIQKGYVEDNIE